jgi:hypothetical protein
MWQQCKILRLLLTNLTYKNTYVSSKFTIIRGREIERRGGGGGEKTAAEM